jgi:exodeoxyribonuclease V alpha subunit
MVHALNDYPFFSSIEKSFVRQAIKELKSEDEALFLAYLFYSSKMGHIAIEINNDINPSFDEITLELKEKIIRGAKNFKGSPLVASFNNTHYLKKNFDQETYLLELLNQRLSDSCFKKIPCLNFDSSALLEKQKEAVQMACQSNLLLLTGGPGTGKTHTATYLIETIISNLPENEKENYEVTIAAPTGRAQFHLFTSLTKKIANPEILKKVHAKTLHSLFDLKSQNFDLFEEPNKKLSSDLVVVDESSMIDLAMMTRLFSSLKKGSRLVLIGDKNQLPPIESGSVFYDLLHILKDQVVELDVCVRSDIKEIIDFSRDVKKGIFDPSKHQSFLYHYDSDEEKNQKFVLEEILSKDPKHFRVLAPLRKGALGIEEINKLAIDAYRKKNIGKKEFSVPILFTKNDHKRAIYNGQNGVLHFDKNAKPLLIETEEKKGLPSDFPPYELAFCLSIHKSQGSEYDHVLVVMPSEGQKFGREILYTAITRAKKSVSILTERATLDNLLKKESIRLSSLYVRGLDI